MAIDELTVFENHKKVSFNIASEASYVYIRQKFIKKAKNSQFEKLKRANSVTRQVNFNELLSKI